MEWNYYNWNLSSFGNGTYEENFGTWPYISANYDFSSGSIFGKTLPNIHSAILNEIFKSSAVTIFILSTVTQIKSTSFKYNVNFILEICLVALVALAFYIQLALFLIPFVIYRSLVTAYFYIWKPSCVLMHGTDAFWCMDTPQARSIINVLIQIEVEQSETDLLPSLTELMIKLCSDPLYGWKFMSYLKKSPSGYHYWEKGRLEDVKNNLKYIERDIADEDELNKFVSEMSNEEISGFGWEVLIARSDIDGLRPIVFRMHHSIGDGASILKVLINTFSDRTRSRFTMSHTLKVSQQSAKRDFKFRIPSQPVKIRMDQLLKTLKKIPVFIYGPLHFIRDMLDVNKNKFLVDELDGRKIMSWRNDEETLRNIKTIKKKTGSTFSEVVFTLLSDSLERYLTKDGVPNKLNVVVPIFNDDSSLNVKSEIVENNKNIRVSKLSRRDLGMENGFWVAMLRLPVKSSRGETKLKSVKRSTELLKRSPDFIMYKFMLSVVVTLVPGFIVKPLFNVARPHLVFSNLPGPQNEISVARNRVKQMAFWLPNRGVTGLGFSLLSNNDKLSLGLIADTALISDKDELDAILNDFVDSARKEAIQ